MEAWADPIGHDVLYRMLQRHGLGEQRFLRSLLARSSLARLAFLENTVFVDSFVEMMNLRGAADEQRGAGECEKAPWWKSGVAYRIYVPSFMDSDQDGYGDLRGVLQRLPYLEKLGVDILWLSPLLCEEGGGVADFQKISEDFGSTSDFVELARSAHERGMKVIFDIDLGATSDRHPWFQQALQGRDECRDYYVTREGGEQDRPQMWDVGALSRSWQFYPASGMWALKFGKANRMALNWKNPAVRREISSAVRYWIGLGADGFCARQAYMLQEQGEDKALDDQLINVCGYEKYGYEPELHSYLAQTRAEVMPPAETLLIADVPGVGTGTARLLSGDSLGQFDMVLDESHLWPPRRGKLPPPAALAGLKEYFISRQADASVPWVPLLFESPNLPRLIGSLGAPPQYRALLAKLLGTWLLTMRGMPAIFQGEELGLPGARSVAANDRGGSVWGAAPQVDVTRSTMPWSTGHAYGFSGGEPWTKSSRMAEYLNVDMQLSDRNSVLNHYRSLIALRKDSAALVCGGFTPVFADSRKVMCYFRALEGEKWYIELNLTEREVARPGRIDGTQRLELSNYGQGLGTALRPYEANLYRCE